MVVMDVRKLAFCICENKGADQLRANCAADQHLCFRYIGSTMPLLPKPLAIFLLPYSMVVSGQVGNPEGRFSRDAAQGKKQSYIILLNLSCDSLPFTIKYIRYQL